MIVTKMVQVKVTCGQEKYWRNLGYSFEKPNMKHKLVPTITVSTDHLKENSNVDVECWCEGCDKFFTKRFSQYNQYCEVCIRKEIMSGNTHGKANRGKKHPSMTGELNFRWNPNKSEFNRFAYKVRYQTHKVYEANKHIINPDNHPRTLCGVEGGYQLDHKISIKYGFDNNLTVDELANISNLEILPWKNNRNKGSGTKHLRKTNKEKNNGNY